MTPLLNNFDYTTYLSAFTTRYGSPEMRTIWSEIHKRKLWRKIWAALAKVEYKQGLLSKEELSDILSQQENIDIPQAHAYAKEIYHELMSEIKTYASQAPIGGGKLHLGATSADILDNATIIQVHESLRLTRTKLVSLLDSFSKRIEENKDIVCMGYTHLQPAEPTTLGYRLAFYTQDLLHDLQLLDNLIPFIQGKGMKGAVGTSASYTKLLTGKKYDAFQLEDDVLKELGISAVNITGQTYPRKIDWLVVMILSSIAASLHKFCFDFRIMVAPNFGEWSEKIDKKRVGSSAMPFKKNPDKVEKICSLARFVSSLQTVAWSNPANSLLERTLDDSANQRIFLPEGFLAIDECLTETQKIVQTFVINQEAVTRNLYTYGDFSATESLLMDLVKKGGDRQEMHEKLKELSFLAWTDVQRGKPNPLQQLLLQEPTFLSFLSTAQIQKHFNPLTHIGIAKERTQRFLKILQKYLRS